MEDRSHRGSRSGSDDGSDDGSASSSGDPPDPGPDPLAALRATRSQGGPAEPTALVPPAVERLAAVMGIEPLLLARVLLGLVLVAGLAAGLLWWSSSRDPDPPPRSVAERDAALPFATTTTPSTTTPAPQETADGGTNPETLVVHAAGAVVSPGVYEVPAGSRVADVVAAAGGLAADADGDRLNLAGSVADGSRVYVPRVGEVAVPEIAVGGPGGGAGAGSSPLPGSTDAPGSAGPAGSAEPIDINSADEAELEDLPGIGPATAAAVVAHRRTHGPFRSVDDLLAVRGIGPARLEQIRPLVRV